MTSDTNNVKETMSLLCDTNARLCGQVEIFDAIAADFDTDATGNGRKSTAIGQLRRQLEEENEMLQSRCEQKAQAPFVQSLVEESEVPTASIQSKTSTGKGKVGPTPPLAEFKPNSPAKKPNTLLANEDKIFGRPEMTQYIPPTPSHMRSAGKKTNSALDRPEVSPGVQNKHDSVLIYYEVLCNRFLAQDSHIKTAFEIEFARAQQWGDHVKQENRARGFWSLCESVLTSKETLLKKVFRLKDTQDLPVLNSPHSDVSSGWLRPGHEAYDEGEIFTKGSSESSQKNHKEWLEESVCQLSYWNDTLLDLGPPSMQDSLRRSLRVSFSACDFTEVQVQDLASASALLGHSDLEYVAKAKIKLQHPHDTISDNNLLWLERDEISWPGMPSCGPDTVTIATYRDESVIILWLRNYTSLMPIKDLRLSRYLSSSSEVFNAGLSPLSLSSLHILGYFDHKPDLLGCVYRLPPNRSSGQLPMTLHDLLDRATTGTRPELGKLFEMSIALVKTVHDLHTVGLDHGDIAPKNILFWPTADARKELDLGRPYLIGFGFQYGTRPLGLIVHLGTDLGGLGRVLSDIGSWGRKAYLGPESEDVEGRQRERSGNWHEDERPRLREYVGSRYEDAVKACLRLEILFRPNTEEGLQTHLQEFQAKVVDQIAMCNA